MDGIKIEWKKKGTQSTQKDALLLTLIVMLVHILISYTYRNIFSDLWRRGFGVKPSRLNPEYILMYNIF